MFRKLCGDTAVRNVVIVTNMWGVVDPRVGEAREAELIREEMFFKPVLEMGAQMARHENTVSSAERIIRLVLDNNPIPLQIQMELVEEGKAISETIAGEELTRELNARLKEHEEEMRVLKKEMDQAVDDKEEETRRELEIETLKTQKEIARFENDAKRLGSDYNGQKERLEARLKKAEEEGGLKAEQVANQCQRQIDELKKLIEASVTASEMEKAQMREEINELSGRRARVRRRPGFFAKIGGFLDDLLG